LLTPEEPEPVTRLRLELAPPLLGEVAVDLRHDGGVVTAHAVVSQPATEHVLRQVEAQVQQMLQAQGLRMGAFDVSTRDGGQGRAMPQPPLPSPPGAPLAAAVAEPPRPPRQAPRTSYRVIDLYA